LNTFWPQERWRERTDGGVFLWPEKDMGQKFIGACLFTEKFVFF